MNIEAFHTQMGTTGVFSIENIRQFNIYTSFGNCLCLCHFMFSRMDIEYTKFSKLFQIF